MATPPALQVIESKICLYDWKIFYKFTHTHFYIFRFESALYISKITFY